MNEGMRFEVAELGSHSRIAELVGHLIARWSLAEASLMLPLLVAMNSDNQEVAAAILSSTNSTEGKIKLVKTAVDNMTHCHELQDPIRKALKRLEGLCEERNTICHHVWAFDAHNKCMVTIDYRRPKDPGRFKVRSEDSLRSICNRIVDVAKEISSASGSTWIGEEGIGKLRL